MESHIKTHMYWFIQRKKNVILHIDTEPVDINAAILNNRTDLRYLRTLHNCLIGKSILYLPVTLCDNASPADVKNDLCEKCQELGLIVSKDTFRNKTSFETWWQSVETLKETSQLVNKSNKEAVNASVFLASIIGFMVGVASFDDVPGFPKNPRFKDVYGNNEKTLRMLLPDHHDLVNFDNDLKFSDMCFIL